MKPKKLIACNGRIQPRRNEQIIGSLAYTVSELWQKACDFDSIPSDSKFVVFSDQNKYAQFYNNAMLQLTQAIQEANAGGYVGLSIQNGRAR